MNISPSSALTVAIQPETPEMGGVISDNRELITNLARHQLQGKLEINTNGGTEIKVVFRELG